ncbi:MULTISPECIES: META domain-containing protein [Chitinophagaceae]
MKKRNILLGCIALVGIGLYSCETISSVTNSVVGKKTVSAPIVEAKKSNVLSGKWKLNYITGPRITFDGLYPNKKPFMILDSSKLQVSGNTGCNNFSGPFTLQNDSVHFRDLATTMMSCMDGGQGETIFLGMLAKVSHYRVSGDTLWLRYKKLDAMRFVRDTSTVSVP